VIRRKSLITELQRRRRAAPAATDASAAAVGGSGGRSNPHLRRDESLKILTFCHRTASQLTHNDPSQTPKLA
jgi:hypothetical protein